MNAIEFLVIFVVVAVGGGSLLGAYIDWRSEKKADAEIKKHDAEVARKMREKNSNSQKL
jgi:hypothetical protein